MQDISSRSGRVYRYRSGFTLPEMLIAMAVTLLLMAALSKSFGLIGESVREGRATVQLTATARDITLRLNDELSRCTVALTPPITSEEGDGYFVYYEGPVTDHTGVMMGTSPDTSNNNTYQDAKYGDFDDYIAFTAVAQDGNWFQGKVPRFIVDMKTVSLLPVNNDADPSNDVAYAAADFPGSPTDPILIESKFAEIIYFASPEYQLLPDDSDNTKRIFQYGADGNPLVADADGNGIADRIKLHRRVLLIRPDLNLTSNNPALSGNRLQTYTAGSGYTFMNPDTWPSDTTTAAPAIKTPGTHGISVAQVDNAWLMGMAPVHQQCDLSVRRLLNAAGLPTNQVAANSLADLTRPENRFAHVRMPGNLIASGHHSSRPFTSMPLLALGGRQPILDPATNSAVPPNATGDPVVTPLILNGFLRPEFVLGTDHTHTDVIGDRWGLDRLGEDVIAANVLAFDGKGYDPQVVSYIGQGADAAFGAAGVDDDLNGNVDDTTEAGYSNTDDVIITPNDVAMRRTLVELSSGNTVAIFGQQGGYVDLFYPFLAGGTVRGSDSLNYTVHVADADAIPVAAASGLSFRGQFESPLSGLTNRYRLPNNYASPFLLTLYSPGLYKSGRVLTSAAGDVVIVQPAYDTFSDSYENDGFLQTFPSRNGGSGFGTVWYQHNADGSTPGSYRTPDVGANGIDDDGLNGADDMFEKETSAPFPEPMSSVRISVRLEDTTTRQVMQMSSVGDFSTVAQ